MKQMIVLTAMVCLGCFMFQLILGGNDSIYSSVKNVWKSEVGVVRNYP